MAIRLCAAASVIFSHSFLIGEGTEENEPLVQLLGPHNILGIYGVFIFFIASGFLITQSALASSSPASYAWKRVRRIYPALIVCVVLCAVLLGPWFSSLGPSAYFRQLIPLEYLAKTLLDPGHGGWQIPTVTLYPSDNYVGEGINGSLWTIPQEIHCYVIVGVLLFTKLLRPWVLVLLCALSLPFTIWEFAGYPSIIKNFPFVFPFFAFGSLLFFVHRRWGFDGRIALLFVGAGIAAAVAGRFMELFQALGSYPLLWLATSRSVRLPTLQGIGDISYGLYLYGWPVEQMVRVLLGEQAGWFPVFAISLPVAALLGYASWHLVEKRALQLKGLVQFLRRPKPQVVLSKDIEPA